MSATWTRRGKTTSIPEGAAWGVMLLMFVVAPIAIGMYLSWWAAAVWWLWSFGGVKAK